MRPQEGADGRSFHSCAVADRLATVSETSRGCPAAPTVKRRSALSWTRDARPDLRAERVDSGLLVLRDRQEIRATLGLVPSGSGSGAPLVAAAAPGVAPDRLDLPTDVRAAEVVLRRALAAI